ncbi:penicillin-binding protein [Gangjinia marincola]|uniref:Penicillin-binding protein n=1 Tax=Gangjinia marincola TaxID=578463 RepID=A0ABN1MJL4_9FLAO
MDNEKNILSKLYFIAGCMFIFAVLISLKLLNIQFIEGAKYKKLAQKTVYKDFTIPANRGNLYDANGNLLATSVSKYDIRFDAVTVSQKNFEENVVSLSKELSAMLGRPSSYYTKMLRSARINKNRYLLVAKGLGYSEYIKIKTFPMFNLGAYKGGFITEQRTVREHPLGKVAQRTVGYDTKGKTQVGLEGAFSQYLRGEDGHRKKQRIAKGQWKPISDANEMEPRDGLDVMTTIDVKIQDIAHHALLAQLEKYEADHGTAIVMETATGEIKAMSNLGRGASGFYFEKRNYAVWESHEPGSTFKLMALVAALEDKVVDTSTVYDTEGGKIKYFDRIVRDSKKGGYGEISVGRAFEVSSNTVFSKFIYENYKNNPKKFINRLVNMGLDEKLGLEIVGEGNPKIPHPSDKDWYGTTLPWMSFGYGVSMTPLQTLAFYNAIANDGKMVKPKFIKEIRAWDKSVKTFDKEVINPSICSQSTVDKVKVLLENTVKRGTADNIYTPSFSMAGKTGTCLIDYGTKGDRPSYISSFAGYFPADTPKYSCIVVIHKPNNDVGYYGNTVAAPVFKRIAQKIYTDTPVTDELESVEPVLKKEAKSYEAYYTKAQKYKTIMPDVKGLPVMDAVALLENIGIRVVVNGQGVVKSQSIDKGEKIQKNQEVTLSVG